MRVKRRTPMSCGVVVGEKNRCIRMRVPVASVAPFSAITGRWRGQFHRRFSSKILACQSLPLSSDLAAVGSGKLRVRPRRQCCEHRRASSACVVMERHRNRRRRDWQRGWQPARSCHNIPTAAGGCARRGRWKTAALVVTIRDQSLSAVPGQARSS